MIDLYRSSVDTNPGTSRLPDRPPSTTCAAATVTPNRRTRTHTYSAPLGARIRVGAPCLATHARANGCLPQVEWALDISVLYSFLDEGHPGRFIMSATFMFLGVIVSFLFDLEPWRRRRRLNNEQTRKRKRELRRKERLALSAAHEVPEAIADDGDAELTKPAAPAVTGANHCCCSCFAKDEALEENPFPWRDLLINVTLVKMILESRRAFFFMRAGYEAPLSFDGVKIAVGLFVAVPQSFLQTFVVVEDTMSNLEPNYKIHLSIFVSFGALAGSLSTLGRSPNLLVECLVTLTDEPVVLKR